jgi:NAD+ dependent glucose-6-phosphate dehydrogenase
VPKRIGITGAGGNVGTTLTKGLAPSYDLVLFDSKPLPADSPGTHVRIDCAEDDLLEHLRGLDAVVHLAGNPYPDAPRSATWKNNFVAFSRVADAAQRAGVPRIVFASSNFYHEGMIGELLRRRSREKITLDMPPTPVSYYGESKVYAESVGRHLAIFGMCFVALRIGWTVPGNNPSLYAGDYMRAVFCSHADLVQAFTRALETDRKGFTAGYAVSANTNGIFDLAETARVLEFTPRDNVEDLL